MMKSTLIILMDNDDSGGSIKCNNNYDRGDNGDDDNRDSDDSDEIENKHMNDVCNDKR